MSKDILTARTKNGKYEYVYEDGMGYYIKYCKGCKTYEEGRLSLTEEERKELVYLCNVSVPVKPDTGKLCPCSTCIIKMMCTRKCNKLDSHIECQSIKIGDKKK